MIEEVTFGHIEVLKTEIKHLHKVMELNEKALKLQSREYERRLEALNGEAERLRKMQSTYVPREVYEAKYDELVANIEKNRTQLATMTGKTMGIKDFRDWIPWIITLVMFLIYLWKK